MEPPRSKTEGAGQDGQKKVAEARKRPPPEKPEAVRLRTQIVFSFWILIVLLGVPVWWRTTSIYRAPLPLQEMLDWSEGRVCNPQLPLEVWVVSPSLACEDARLLTHTAQETLDSMAKFPAQPIRLRLAESKQVKDNQGRSLIPSGDCALIEHEARSPQPAMKLHFVPNEDVSDIELSFHMSSTKVDVLYGEVSIKRLGSFAAKTIHSIFAEDRVALARKLTSLSPNDEAASYLDSVPEDIKSTVSSRENRALKYAETYYLTFSLFTPGGAPSSWAIEEAVDSYIRPWILALSNISEFSINTQIQPYSAYSPSIQPLRDPQTNHTILSREDLSAFVNAAEWPLSPSIGSRTGPTLNFVLYVPSASEIPLTIASSNGSTSWLIPQWGGVTIFNPTPQPDPQTDLAATTIIPSHLSLESLHHPFEAITMQLLALIGLPSTPQPNLSQTPTPPSRSRSRSLPPLPLPLPFRLKSHTRLQTIQLHLLTRTTLTSLSRLYTSLPNIPIPATVADLVSTSLDHLQRTCTSLHESEWDRGLTHARHAWRDSERAFFEKSMLGQMYFPDEHKVAVYLPLLGPVGVPLVVALLRELAGLGRRWRGGARRGGQG